MNQKPTKKVKLNNNTEKTVDTKATEKTSKQVQNKNLPLCWADDPVDNQKN